MRDSLKNYVQPAFIICVVVLAVVAVLMRWIGVVFEKQPLPIKKPLSLLDQTSIAPFRVVSKLTIGNPDVVESLGTDEYIQWILEDTKAPAASTWRDCFLFITYYDRPESALHAPDECYLGSGYRLASSENIRLNVDCGGTRKEIPARYLVFSSSDSDLWRGQNDFAVLYFFSVNGEYACTRDQTRKILATNLFGKYSYFSKVEWKFFNTILGQMTYPDKQDAISASEKLLAVLLPILEKEHWPVDLAPPEQPQGK